MLKCQDGSHARHRCDSTKCRAPLCTAGRPTDWSASGGRENLESNYRKVPGISAATILGDGSVALIVDVSALQALNREKRVAADEVVTA